MAFDCVLIASLLASLFLLRPVPRAVRSSPQQTNPRSPVYAPHLAWKVVLPIADDRSNQTAGGCGQASGGLATGRTSWPRQPDPDAPSLPCTAVRTPPYCNPARSVRG